MQDELTCRMSLLDCGLSSTQLMPIRQAAACSRLLTIARQELTMEKADIVFIKSVIAFLLLAGTGMSAFWLWLRERRRGRPETDKLVEALREENATVQADLAARIVELEERVDFMERRLVQAPKPDQLPQRRVTTPV